ncbi:MAG: HAD family phosphatase [Pirellula sp.]
MRPDFVYFDLGNVLLYFDHRLAMRKMAKVAGVSYSEMHGVVMESNLQIDYETGTISGEEFVERISEAVGKKLDAPEILQAAADMFVPNTHILPALTRVRELGIPMGLLSNTCEAHWNWIMELRYPQVVGWFSPVILSFEVKSMKPDCKIYEEAQRLSGCPHDRIFFTDDRADNVAAAKNLGWETEQYVNTDRLLKRMENWD